MFSIFKRKNLKSALEECQKKHISYGLGQELSSSIFDMVTNTSLFKDIDGRFKANGLSQYGGLAWFCSQIVTTILTKLEQEEQVEDSMYELAHKMATVALLLANSINSLILTKNDMAAILTAGENANRWLDAIRTEAAEEFFDKVFSKS